VDQEVKKPSHELNMLTPKKPRNCVAFRNSCTFFSDLEILPLRTMARIGASPRVLGKAVAQHEKPAGGRPARQITDLSKA
jgi:hypothetical protein